MQKNNDQSQQKHKTIISSYIVLVILIYQKTWRKITHLTLKILKKAKSRLCASTICYKTPWVLQLEEFFLCCKFTLLHQVRCWVEWLENSTSSRTDTTYSLMVSPSHRSFWKQKITWTDTSEILSSWLEKTHWKFQLGFLPKK